MRCIMRYFKNQVTVSLKYIVMFGFGVFIGFVFSQDIDINDLLDRFEIHQDSKSLGQQTRTTSTNPTATEKPWMPKAISQIDRQGYSLSYDARNKNPMWVYEDLTSDNLQGNVDRKDSAFKEDPIIPTIFRATLSDYRSSGFDRGHMAPAADHKSCPEAMSDTFFMSNMCPQCPQLNRGFWAKLEKHVRDLTKSNAHVYVISGPLYLPKEGRDGKRYIKYQVIGDNDVAVPTHFFKVLHLEKSSGKIETQTFIVPNEPVAADSSIDSFRVTIDKVERVAGLIFSSN